MRTHGHSIWDCVCGSRCDTGRISRFCDRSWIIRRCEKGNHPKYCVIIEKKVLLGPGGVSVVVVGKSVGSESLAARTPGDTFFSTDICSSMNIMTSECKRCTHTRLFVIRHLRKSCSSWMDLGSASGTKVPYHLPSPNCFCSSWTFKASAASAIERLSIYTSW